VFGTVSDTVARDSHFLEACRYVVLNPVRAGLCRSPAQWQWSSYRACAGLISPTFLAAVELLKMFGNRPSEAAARYRAFVASAREAGVRRHSDEARTDTNVTNSAAPTGGADRRYAAATSRNT
jgi:hypothetical protein